MQLQLSREVITASFTAGRPIKIMLAPSAEHSKVAVRVLAKSQYNTEHAMQQVVCEGVALTGRRWHQHFLCHQVCRDRQHV
jgi:hypothetical protein